MPLQIFERRLAQFIRTAERRVKRLKLGEPTQVLFEPRQILVNRQLHEAADPVATRCLPGFGAAEQSQVYEVVFHCHPRPRVERQGGAFADRDALRQITKRPAGEPEALPLLDGQLPRGRVLRGIGLHGCLLQLSA